MKIPVRNVGPGARSRLIGHDLGKNCKESRVGSDLHVFRSLQLQ